MGIQEAASAAVVAATRLERLRSDVAENLRDSEWLVDGETVEAADRDYWLDMAWLLHERDALGAALSEFRYLVHLYRGTNHDPHFDRLADKAVSDHAAASQRVGWSASTPAADAASKEVQS